MGLKAMSSPVTARRGIVVAGVGMLIGTLMSFLYPGMGNFPLMLARSRSAAASPGGTGASSR
jgi:NAD(P) transhydrogenase subunit beta